MALRTLGVLLTPGGSQSSSRSSRVIDKLRQTIACNGTGIRFVGEIAANRNQHRA